MQRPPEFELLATPHAKLGESPVWSAREDCLWWVDIEGRSVFRTDGADGVTRAWKMPEMAGVVAPTGEDGVVVVGMESGLFRLGTASGRLTRVAALEAGNVRFNDAAVDSRGRLWAATMEHDYRRPAGILYRIEPDLSMHAVAGGFFIPNGLAVDEERGRIYVSDSHPDLQTVWAADLDLDSGRLGERHLFARFQDLAGRPDGAAVDAEGNYWIAGVEGARLHVFSPSGEHIGAHLVPVAAPTKIAFGGPDLSRLYLTSKADGGEGGRLAVAHPGVMGRAGTPFGGVGRR